MLLILPFSSVELDDLRTSNKIAWKFVVRLERFCRILRQGQLCLLYRRDGISIAKPASARAPQYVTNDSRLDEI
jgi:hypothetical protein